MDDFTDRMRERMPAHRTWHQTTAAPTLSRPAHDAMWDEMRTRLRGYEEHRRSLRRRKTVARDAVATLTRAAGNRSTAAIIVAAVLLLLTLFGLLK